MGLLTTADLDHLRCVVIGHGNDLVSADAAAAVFVDGCCCWFCLLLLLMMSWAVCFAVGD